MFHLLVSVDVERTSENARQRFYIVQSKLVLAGGVLANRHLSRRGEIASGEREKHGQAMSPGMLDRLYLTHFASIPLTA